MDKRKYPYLNDSLKTIKGEKWKDIPGLEDYFLISNFGRIKRCAREMQYKNGAIYTKEERIIKPYFVKNRNRFKKDYNIFLFGKVTLSGKRYHISISRLVYNCFVQPFNMDDTRFVILAKDSDHFNIRPSNLEKKSLSERNERVVQKGRMRSPFFDMTEADRKKRVTLLVRKLRKEVSQYSLKGKKIRTFSSMVAAEKATKIKSSAIGLIANKKGVSAGGYVWRFGSANIIDVKEFVRERKRKNSERRCTKLTQYDLEGNKIAQYPTYKDAEKGSGAHATAIGAVINGIYKSAKGFYWRKGYGPERIDLSNYKWGHASGAENQWKKVKQYTVSGKYIRTFKSITEAAASVKIRTSDISAVVTGKQKTAKGFHWKYARKGVFKNFFQ